MVRYAADENLSNHIVRGLLRRDPSVDITRVQDVGLAGADDPAVLAWAAQEGRVLLTHDAATITHYAYERVRNNQAMPGGFEIRRTIPVGQVIEDLLLIARYSLENEWESQIRYLPLR